MNPTLLLLWLGSVAFAFPAENQDSPGKSMNDLVSQINKIQARVKEMRGITLGNYTDGIDTQIKDINLLNSLTKNVTYEDLIDKVHQASLKIKEMQALLSGTLKSLDKKYPSPSSATGKEEPEKN